MRIASAVLSVAVLGAWAAGTASAQQGGMPPLPKPGPEHQILKAQEGIWDATVESWMAPGQPPSTSSGVETGKLVGGMWLVTDFTSQFMNQPFQGHGVMGYDPTKKKYVGTWVDSMSTGLGLSEASYDATSKTLTGWFEGPDMSGKITKMKQTTEFKDADTRVFTMSMTGPDGKDVPGMRITYKRRK